MTNDNITPEGRPLGFWLRSVDRLIAHEFQTAFAAEGLTRRDWRILSVLAGDVTAPDLVERVQRGGKVRGIVERGWAARTADGWTLTDEGRAAKERLDAVVSGIRAKVTAAVSDPDYATTVASLEAIARGLGWQEGTRLPRGERRFGRGFRGGFGPRGGFPGRDGFEGDGFPGRGMHGGHGFPGHRRHGHGFPGHREHGHGGPRHAEQAYERGFAAGFAAANGGPTASDAA